MRALYFSAVVAAFLVFVAKADAVGQGFLLPNSTSVWEVKRLEQVLWIPKDSTKKFTLYISVAKKAIPLAVNVMLSEGKLKVYNSQDITGIAKLVLCDELPSTDQLPPGATRISYDTVCSSDSVISDSFNLAEKNYKPGEPYKVSFSTNPLGIAVQKEALPLQPVVAVVDIKNSPVTNQVFVVNLKAVTGEDEFDCSVFSAGVTHLLTDKGVAKFSSLTLDNPNLNYTLVATAYYIVDTPMGQIREYLPNVARSKSFIVEKERPPKDPSNVALDSVTSTSAVIRWQAPAELPNLIDHYEVEVTHPTCCANWLPPKVLTFERPFTLHCLCPETEYIVQVFSVSTRNIKSLTGAGISFKTRAGSAIEPGKVGDNMLVIDKVQFGFMLVGISFVSGVVAVFGVLVLWMCGCNCLSAGNSYDHVPALDQYRAKSPESDDDDEEQQLGFPEAEKELQESTTGETKL